MSATFHLENTILQHLQQTSTRVSDVRDISDVRQVNLPQLNINISQFKNILLSQIRIDPNSPIMDQDWHETILTQKRIPHRLSKSHSKASSSTFDVRKLFGRHQITCSAAKPPSAPSKKKKKKDEANLEVYRLSDDGQGVLGELHLPGVLTCEVVMGGSRKSLAGVIAKLESQTPSAPGETAGQGKGDEDADGSEDEAESDQEVETTHDEPRPTFEKNSFRNPKFWLRFKSPTNPGDIGTGYLVFSGNDCRRFKGTLSSELREWDNVAISGWKAVGMSERDVLFQWGQDGEVGTVEE